MSVRLLTTCIIRHGRNLLHSYWKRDIHTNILEQKPLRNQRFALPTSRALIPNNVAKNVIQTNIKSSGGNGVGRPSSGIFRFGQHARKLFIDNILNRVTTPCSHDLRQQATKRLFYGDSAPFFALIGVSLASGAGVLTKEDELEGVCWEIRENACRLQSKWSYDEISANLDANFNVDKLDIGPPIAKGCAAVVYAAALKDDQTTTTTTTTTATVNDVRNEEVSKIVGKQHNVLGPELLSPMQHISRFVHNFGGSVDNLNVYNQSLAAAAIATEMGEEVKRQKQQRQETFNDNIYEEKNNRLQEMKGITKRYPLALKMMFNYDIQSNALSILRGMHKEIVPARQRLEVHAERGDEEAEWERLMREAAVELPEHPNIVCMYGYFVDQVRALPEGNRLYPVAQPQRINPDGYGRNMSLYLLMKRYDLSLRALLDNHTLTMRTKLLLFAQLLEAVAHLNRHGIAHRDIKSDNLLIELNDEDLTAPLLVLSDFGCCLADNVHGLKLPFNSRDVDKGGNAALMAPEIICKQPGTFSVLNYNKSDLWACGAIAYEIFGQRNPFYMASMASIETGAPLTYLRNANYKQEDLPAINDDECPEIVKQLVYNILDPNPGSRISPDIAANVMQLLLWAPSSWLRPLSGMPNSPEVINNNN